MGSMQSCVMVQYLTEEETRASRETKEDVILLLEALGWRCALMVRT